MGKTDFDVIIVGGGLAGLTLAALLGTRGVQTLCVDRETPQTQLSPAFDGRTTAVSYGSRRVLEAAGIWPPLQAQACPIETIHILDADSPVLLRFSSAEVDGRIFGWIVENRLLRHAMLERVRALKTVRHLAPAAVAGFERSEDGISVLLQDGGHFRGRLVVGADGRGSFTREWMGINTRGWSYKQRAVVCTVTHEQPHDNVAVENFRPDGPFAILPMTDDAQGAHRSSIVWTEHGPEEKSALRYDQDTFNAALCARFPESYGPVKQTGGRFSYPLGLSHAHDYIAPRMALVAEAAHGIHPIAGQGLNMGLRDIAELAELVAEAEDPGAAGILAQYQQRRRFDNMAMAGATDSLNRLFSNDIAPVRLLRRTGLRAVARLPMAKQFFMKQAMGAAGLLPALIREERAA